MSNLAPINQSAELTPQQMELVKSTIAKGASNDELKLFLYRCRSMGLDPLKPGHIHFIKYGNNPGTIVIGIDGFRSKAGQTGKHSGTKRGVLRDDKGKCIGAWCEIYRSDWTHPAREEVALAEYNTGKAQWLKMPETMLKKVAEVAALRMAFPDQLGGIYSDDEMAQAEKEAKPAPKQIVNHAAHLGTARAQALRQEMAPPIETPPDIEAFTEADHDVEDDVGQKIIQVGKKYKGHTFESVGPEQIKQYCDWLEGEANKSGKPVGASMLAFLEDAYRFLSQKGAV